MGNTRSKCSAGVDHAKVGATLAYGISCSFLELPDAKKFKVPKLVRQQTARKALQLDLEPELGHLADRYDARDDPDSTSDDEDEEGDETDNEVSESEIHFNTKHSRRASLDMVNAIALRAREDFAQQHGFTGDSTDTTEAGASLDGPGGPTSSGPNSNSGSAATTPRRPRQHFPQTPQNASKLPTSTSDEIVDVNSLGLDTDDNTDYEDVVEKRRKRKPRTGGAGPSPHVSSHRERREAREARTRPALSPVRSADSRTLGKSGDTSVDEDALLDPANGAALVEREETKESLGKDRPIASTGGTSLGEEKIEKQDGVEGTHQLNATTSAQTDADVVLGDAPEDLSAKSAEDHLEEPSITKEPDADVAVPSAVTIHFDDAAGSMGDGEESRGSDLESPDEDERATVKFAENTIGKSANEVPRAERTGEIEGSTDAEVTQSTKTPQDLALAVAKIVAETHATAAEVRGGRASSMPGRTKSFSEAKSNQCYTIEDIDELMRDATEHKRVRVRPPGMMRERERKRLLRAQAKAKQHAPEGPEIEMTQTGQRASVDAGKTHPEQRSDQVPEGEVNIRGGTKSLEAQYLDEATHAGKLKCYAPRLFQRIRGLERIDEEAYRKALSGDPPYRSLKTNSRSGELFFMTADQRYIIKTISEAESRLFVQNLLGYYVHIRSYPYSLINRVLGMYKLTIKHNYRCCGSLSKITYRILVLQIVYPPQTPLHLQFDLKGSLFNRLASSKDRKQVRPCFKDLDFLAWTWQNPVTSPLGVYLRQQEQAARAVSANIAVTQDGAVTVLAARSTTTNQSNSSGDAPTSGIATATDTADTVASPAPPIDSASAGTSDEAKGEASAPAGEAKVGDLDLPPPTLIDHNNEESVSPAVEVRTPTASAAAAASQLIPVEAKTELGAPALAIKPLTSMPTTTKDLARMIADSMPPAYTAGSCVHGPAEMGPGFRIRLGKERATLVKKQLQRDVDFFKTIGSMDYSLLVSVRYQTDGRRFKSREGVTVHASPTSNPLFSTLSFRRGSALERSAITPSNEAKSYDERERQRQQRQRDTLFRRDGGVLSEDGTCIYYMGIIDFLSEYNFRKKFGKCFQVMCCCASPSLTSPATPEEYARRFMEFMNEAIV